MKPNTKIAMENLIKEVRQKMPFGYSSGCSCDGHCDECPDKLLEFLDIDLLRWEDRLKKGEVPSIGDLYALGSICKNVHLVLEKKKLVSPLTT